jgi:Flp pilus assembly protein TadG
MGSRRGTHRRGAAVIETVLALLALLPVAFGTIEFSYYLYVKSTAQGAAREGARAAIVPWATMDDVNDAADAIMTAAGFDDVNYTTETRVNGVVVGSLTSATAGDDISVVVSGPFGSFGVRPLGMIAANKPVQGSCTMRKE